MSQPMTEHTQNSALEPDVENERYYMATQWQLMWRRLKRHRLALVGMVVLAIIYGGALLADFLSPYNIYKRHTAFIYSPPQQIHFVDSAGGIHWQPFVYGWTTRRHPVTYELLYEEDTSVLYPLRLFQTGDRYELFGIIPMRARLFGTDQPGTVFLFGTDHLGRDILSRILMASRVSLSIGLIGVAFSFILGCILGGISGFYGGLPDTLIQRLIEFLLSIPTIPLWMALAAAVPADWPPLQVYLMITVILSIVGWCGLARVVRGKLISLRSEDYVVAAIIAGATDARVIRRHLLPAFMSYLIVNLTLAIPGMILGETALSFLGLGLREPVVSWGVLLSVAQDVKVVILYPWILTPGAFVVATVLAFNFLGDGLRDAADPYHT